MMGSKFLLSLGRFMAILVDENSYLLECCKDGLNGQRNFSISMFLMPEPFSLTPFP